MMKLDRNINPDGRGKYALINLRKNTVEWGGDDQFFVIKYKDEFAADALQAYADAVKAKVAEVYGKSLVGRPKPNSMPDEVERHRAELRTQAEDLADYAEQIEAEARLARNWPNKKLPD